MPGRAGSGAQALVTWTARTRAAPGARVELHRELRWPQAQCGGWRGYVLRLAAKGGKVLVSVGWTLAAWRLETTRSQQFGHLVEEGAAEPARGRYMVRALRRSRARGNGATWRPQ